MPNYTFLINIITTRLTEHIVAVVGNTAKGIININYKAIIKVLIEVYFKVIIKRSITFIISQIASQLDILLISKRRHITNFTRVQETSEIVRLLQPTFKSF